MILYLKARHFKDTDYEDNCNCALAKAAKEQLKEEDISEGVGRLHILDGNTVKETYIHELYTPSEFNEDLANAKAYKFTDTVVREVILTKK